jgi:hypothetical protein
LLGTDEVKRFVPFAKSNQWAQFEGLARSKRTEERMTAKEKIEGLTNTWYGFALVGAVYSLFQNGFGFFSLLTTGASFLFSVALTWFLGGRLIAKSSFWRAALLIVSAIGTVIGTLTTARTGWQFFHEWSLTLLATTAMFGSSVYMNARSFRVLTDKTVKAYFN